MARLKWNRSREGYTETKDGRYEIAPEYEGTTRPQSFRLWHYGEDGKRQRAGSHDTQWHAKYEAQRLNDEK